MSGGDSAQEQREQFVRRSSKSRLSKQDSVEDPDDCEDHSPSSEASDATIVPTVGVDTPVVHTPGGSPSDTSPDDSKLESQPSTDSDKSSPTSGSNPKSKLLVRSKAVCEDASPPPDDCHHSESSTSSLDTCTIATPNTDTLAVSPTLSHRSRKKLEKDGSQSSVSDNGNSPMLSRDSSVEYTDSTGTDLEQFIKSTLNNKNRQDRLTLLDLETKMMKFIKDSKQQYYKFSQMSSYHRMLVHRVAAFFGLDHNVDQSGKCVVVNRTTSTRLPEFKFREFVQEDLPQEDAPKQRLILKRDRECSSFDDGRSPERIEERLKKSRSLEEREVEYRRTRNRIFNQQDSNSSQENLMEPRERGGRHGSRGSSKEDLRWPNDKRAWSSTDSSSGYSSGTENSLRTKGAMTKASSFPGYTLLTRGDSRVSSGNSTKHLSKTDSTSSGVSSLNSPMTRPPPIPSSPPPESEQSETGSSSQSATSPSQTHTDGASPIPFTPIMGENGQPVAIWVASSMDVIPPGSILINPQTAQPFMNKDGSPLRWQPAGDPQMPPQQVYPQQLAPPSLPAQPQPPQAIIYTNHQGAPPQQQHAPLPYQQSQDSSAGDISHQMSSMNISSQPPGGGDNLGEPPGGQNAALPQQALYNMVSNPQMAAPAPQGFMQTPQMPYSGTQTLPGNQLRYMYPNPTIPYQAAQGQVQGQTPVDVQGQGQANGQFPGGATPQQGGMRYSVPTQRFPQMTVQSVETFPNQGYPQSGQSFPAEGQPGPADIPPTQYPQAPMNQGTYSGPSNSIVYYTTTASSHSGTVTYPMMGAPAGQGPPQTGGVMSTAYPPKTPPSQIMCAPGTAGMGPGGPQCSSQSNLATAVPAPSNNAPVTSQAYPFTYPQQQQQQQQPCVAAGQLQPAPQTGPMPRQQSPAMWTFQQGAPNMPVQGAPQGYQFLRPNMPVGVPLHSGTTPPPQAGVSLMQGPVKVIPIEQWPGGEVKEGEVVAGQVSVVPTVLPLRPGCGAMFRPTTPVSPDARFVGPPLQQMGRPGLTPQLVTLKQAGPRLPLPPHGRGGRRSGGKPWSRGSSQEGISPQSSVESGAVLEVYGFPQHLQRADLDSYLDDLSKQGARIQVYFSPHSPGGGGDAPASVSECTVMAVFDSESMAQQAFASQSGAQYSLRAPSTAPSSSPISVYNTMSSRQPEVPTIVETTTS